MNLSIRPATNDDRAAVERLVFGVLAEYGLRPDPEGTDADLQDIRGNYHGAGGAFEVLVDEAGEVVGSVALHRVSASVGELRKMYLAREARGQGWGRKMLEHALRRAEDLGFARVELETASVLREAIGLYERRGFQRFTPSHLAGRCDRAYFLDLRRTQP